MINLFRYGVLLLTMQIAVAQLDVAYVRYFQDDHNFLSNLSMMSTSRRGVAHLAVSYNEKDLPIKIERITAKGNIEKREMLKYDETGKLIERGEYTDKWKYLNLTVIGDNEPWSQEFRAWRFARGGHPYPACHQARLRQSRRPRARWRL